MAVPSQRLIAATRRGVNRFADVMWPMRCAGCDLPGLPLCERCRTHLRLIDRASACPACGAPDGSAGCAECGHSSHAFAAARCAGVLEWPLDRMVTLMKDAGERRFLGPLASLLADAAGEWCDEAEAVVGIPASPGAVVRRGFDHGALLAAEFSALTGVPALEVLRGLPRRDQRHLDRGVRAVNARDSVAVRAGVAVPSRILVVDDVMTTGATLDAAAAALLHAGAVEVRALTVARACSGRL